MEQIRERCVREGLPAALERKKRPREPSQVLCGEGEVRAVSLASSKQPAGQTRGEFVLKQVAELVRRNW